MNDITPGPGHNNPPVTIADMMAEKYAALCVDQTEVLKDFANPPDKIPNDVVHGKVLDGIKKLRAIKSKLTDARDAERKPYGDAYDQVNGFFNFRIEPLDKVLKQANGLHKDYADRKALEEKRRLEEEAEKKRAAEREALRLAEDAQRTKNDLESAQRNAETLADIARQAREYASSEVQIAQADLAQANAEHAQLKSRLAEIDLDFANRRKDKDPTATEDNRRAAREELRAASDAIKAKISDCEKLLAERKAEAEEAKRRQRQADEEAAELARRQKAATRDVRDHMETAVKADKAATKLEDKAAGPEADLARARTEHGAVGTVGRRWVAEIIDDTKLDTKALWPFIDHEAKRVALYKWMMQQAPENRKMAGARMDQDTVGYVV